jgi:hypothetical protein
MGANPIGNNRDTTPPGRVQTGPQRHCPNPDRLVGGRPTYYRGRRQHGGLCLLEQPRQGVSFCCCRDFDHQSNAWHYPADGDGPTGAAIHQQPHYGHDDRVCAPFVRVFRHLRDHFVSGGGGICRSVSVGWHKHVESEYAPHQCQKWSGYIHGCQCRHDQAVGQSEVELRS